MAKQTVRKKETRQNMIAAASRNFRSFGYNGVGVDAIAKDAKVTSGAFYAHLRSKDAAFAIALEAGLDEVIEAIPIYQAEHGKKWVEAFASYYLGKPHRDNMACGCAMASLSPDVVRADDHIRSIYEDRMAHIVDLIAGGLEGDTVKLRREKAWMFLSILIGGLTTARAVRSPDLAAKIADSAKRAGIILAS